MEKDGAGEGAGINAQRLHGTNASLLPVLALEARVARQLRRGDWRFDLQAGRPIAAEVSFARRAGDPRACK